MKYFYKTRRTDNIKFIYLEKGEASENDNSSVDFIESDTEKETKRVKEEIEILLEKFGLKDRGEVLQYKHIVARSVSEERNLTRNEIDLLLDGLGIPLRNEYMDWHGEELETLLDQLDPEDRVGFLKYQQSLLPKIFEKNEIARDEILLLLQQIKQNLCVSHDHKEINETRKKIETCPGDMTHVLENIAKKSSYLQEQELIGETAHIQALQEFAKSMPSFSPTESIYRDLINEIDTVNDMIKRPESDVNVKDETSL